MLGASPTERARGRELGRIAELGVLAPAARLVHASQSPLGADARPTDQGYEVYEILASRVNKQLAKLDDVLDQDVPAFNRVVRENDIPAVSIEE